MTYSIGEIEEITGVKAHTLRYWETDFPAFAPKKDMGGRRIYTSRDLDLILRLNYLINKRKFTLEGARNEIIRETADYDKNAEALDKIRQIRAELTELYMIVRKYRK